MKKINNQNDINIYINLYVHYPETFNGTIINDKLKEYFDKYFLSCKIINTEIVINSDVMINSLSHFENEIVEIKVSFDKQLDNLINKEVIKKEWEQHIKNFFNSNIKEVNIVFLPLL